MSRVVRIGNAHAFWGDRADAASELLRLDPDLDFVTLDYLAEVSLSILAQQRAKDPSAGYPRDFLQVVESLAPYWSSGGRCRLVTNAGGLDPLGCARACAEILAQHGCGGLIIGVVTGDSVLETMQVRARDTASVSDFQNLDSGQALATIAGQLVTANAYLGAAPIVEALNRGAHLVITGRVADPSLVVAPCIHHFGWQPDAWHELAGATVAGHLIECGTQLTGGISTDWLGMNDPDRLGFPIVEVDQQGQCVVTKAAGSGGRVDESTVKEQLLYELLNPARYLSPDVTVSFLGLKVQAVGPDRVQVSGAIGRPAPELLKVSATYRDGYRAAGTLTIIGRDAVAKARRCGQIVLQRVRAAGYELRDSVVECLGAGACWPVPRANENESREVVLRIAVEADSREAVEQFTRELMPLVTSGPQGTTGYAEGRPRVHSVFRYWPCLIPRHDIVTHVEFVKVERSTSPEKVLAHTPTPQKALESRVTGSINHIPATRAELPVDPSRTSTAGTLGAVAYARSGDKGMHANIGVLARQAADYPRLLAWLTADRVAEYLKPLGAESVERFEVPNLHGLNFLVRGILRRNLRTDAQGKTLGQVLLELPLDTHWTSDTASSDESVSSATIERPS